MNNNAYNNIVKLDAEATEAIQQYLITRDEGHLLRVRELLKPITAQEIGKVVTKLNLQPSDVLDDMFQDAFLKLAEAVGNWRPERCPVFVTFWRTCLHRHLLSAYHSKSKPKELIEDLDAPDLSNKHDNVIFIDEMLTICSAEYEGWKVQFPAYEHIVPMIQAIVRDRILIDPALQVSQTILASSFACSQGYVARWETWLIDQIRSKYNDS